MRRAILASAALITLALPAAAQQAGGSVGTSATTDTSGRTQQDTQGSQRQQLQRDQRRSVTVAAAAVVLPAVASVDLAGTGAKRCTAAEAATRAGKPVDPEDASACLSAMLPAFASGFVAGWPADADPFADKAAASRYAVRVTAYNLALQEWARRQAEALRTGALTDQVEAEEAIATAFRADAPKIWDRYASLRRDLAGADVEIIGDGSCQFGWKIGPHHLCGDKGAMLITRAGTQWAGGDLLGGAQVALTFADAATVTRDRATTTTTTTAGQASSSGTVGIRVGN